MDPGGKRLLRRRLTVFAVVAGMLVVGASAAALVADRGAGGPCGQEERIPIQGGEHLIGDASPPVPYHSTPPTSGWHTSGSLEIRVFGDEEALSEPRQVGVLEAGGVVVTHHGLETADRRALEDFIAARYPGRVAVTPYPELGPGQVALAAWGRLQRCDAVDLEAIRAFANAHAAPRPAGHTDPSG